MLVDLENCGLKKERLVSSIERYFMDTVLRVSLTF
jgi:hypothetical protein